MIWDDALKRPTEEDFERLFDKIRADIGLVGWSAIGVMDDPPFTYTIGLIETYDHPELIVYGVSNQNAHGILGCAIERIKGEGLEFQPGERYSEILEDYEVEFREHPQVPLNWAAHYYEFLDGRRPDAMQVLQLVWPDPDGNFPGEELMDPDFERMQEPHSD